MLERYLAEPASLGERFIKRKDYAELAKFLYEGKSVNRPRLQHLLTSSAFGKHNSEDEPTETPKDSLELE